MLLSPTGLIKQESFQPSDPSHRLGLDWDSVSGTWWVCDIYLIFEVSRDDKEEDRREYE